MSTILWRIADCSWLDKEPEVDTILVTVVNGRTGEPYGVTCTGPKGMKSDQFVTAIRAALAGLMLASGGDMSEIGARPLDVAEGSKSVN
jgi:hypothetical protein